jgi:hypothetical protein
VADSIKRRDFLKTASLLGASVAMGNTGSAKTLLPGNEGYDVKNDYFSILFDKKRGTINIYRNIGSHFITGASACANLPDGKHSIASASYKHRLDVTDFSDQLGHGKRLFIFSKDGKNNLDFEIRLSLYDHLEAVTVEAICKNVSKHDLVINSLEPIRVIKDEGGMLHIPGVSKCITNGEMYYDAGMIHEFGNKEGAISSGIIKGVKLANGPISSGGETIHSWWNAGLFSGYDKEGLVLGYLENNSCLGNLLIAKSDSGQLSFL